MEDNAKHKHARFSREMMTDLLPISRRLGLVAAVLVVSTVRGAAPTDAENLVRNPSFEQDENQDGFPDGWKSIELCTPYRTTKCEHDRSTACEGKCSVTIRQGHLYSNITGTAGWIQRGIVERGGGKTFRVAVHVRARKPEKSNAYVKTIFPTRVRLYLFGAEPKTGSDYTGAASPVFEIGEEWQKISHTNTFASNIAAVSLILAREAQVGGGDVCFDSVKVVEIKWPDRSSTWSHDNRGPREVRDYTPSMNRVGNVTRRDAPTAVTRYGLADQCVRGEEIAEIMQPDLPRM